MLSFSLECFCKSVKLSTKALVEHLLLPGIYSAAHRQMHGQREGGRKTVTSVGVVSKAGPLTPGPSKCLIRVQPFHHLISLSN